MRLFKKFNEISKSKIKSVSFLIDTVTNEYLKDDIDNKILNIVMKDGKLYRGTYIGRWKK